MRKVIVSMYMTLDGRVDALQEWAAPHDSEHIARYHSDLLANSDGLIIGRRTYEVFAAIWPPRLGKIAYGDKINSMAKHVASTTLTDLKWGNSHLLGGGDVAEGVAKLKQEPGQDLVVYGGPSLVQTLQRHDLVDEYRIMLHPVVLGKGTGLFDDGDPRVDLDLVGTGVLPGGVAVLTYRPAGGETGRVG
ncbi:dihydrofolate reductase family protein [Actinosynnema sp. NPDC023658]|uniref:dihydrofolate reductase family protein n=1 Tax=Actinosynnema sp. NPDC023658 TaxID=3155465 RepID=UPI0034012B31